MKEDAWAILRARTPARIALGRAGGSLPTGEWLKFSWDHAEARDAVHTELDQVRIENELVEAGLMPVKVASRATDRMDYLRRPDLGCLLNDESRDALMHAKGAGCDVAIIVADGLSAAAAQVRGAAVAKLLAAGLKKDGYSVGAVAVARFARVALQDEIGELLKARASVIVLGERPGLGTAESLGAYLIFAPSKGKMNADRNCVSNIRPGGLAIDVAATTLTYLIQESLRRGISGVELKDVRLRENKKTLDA